MAHHIGLFNDDSLPCTKLHTHTHACAPAGSLFTRGAWAEVGAKLSAKLPAGESRTGSTQGIVMRIRGDGQPYALVLGTGEGRGESTILWSIFCA
jgi:hypothetical protein